MAERLDNPLKQNENITEIFLKDMRLRANLGVHGHERGRTQPLVVSVRAWANILPTKDELAETVDYTLFSESARQLGAERHFDLIETWLEAWATRIFVDDRIIALELRAEKPEAVHEAHGAGVVIFRRRPV